MNRLAGMGAVMMAMTAIAADGRKAVRNLALVLNPPEQRGVKC